MYFGKVKHPLAKSPSIASPFKVHKERGREREKGRGRERENGRGREGEGGREREREREREKKQSPKFYIQPQLSLALNGPYTSALKIPFSL